MTTYEYLYDKIGEIFKEFLDKRQEVIDAIIEYYGEDRVWVTTSREKYQQKLLLSLNKIFIEDNINPPYQQLRRTLLECSIEEINNTNILKDIQTKASRYWSQSIDINADCIIIYYPEITVTNEYNSKHTIYDVYIKVQIGGNRILNFTINRTTYSISEIKSGYIHSHTASRNLISFNNSNYRQYSNMCLGTGPIKSTLKTLASKEREVPIEIVGLFCQELDNYLKTESLQGGPYIGMSELNPQESLQSIYTPSPKNEAQLTPTMAKQFSLAVIKAGFLTFCNYNGTLIISNPYIELLQKVSAVIKNLNITTYSDFYSKHSVQCIFSGLECKILENQNKRIDLDSLKNKEILLFKENLIKLKILEDPALDNSVIILKPSVIDSILFYVTLYLNNYGYSKTNI